MLPMFTSAACDVIEEQMRQKVTPPRVNVDQRIPKTPEAPSIAFPISKPAVPPEPQVSSSYTLKANKEVTHAVCHVNPLDPVQPSEFTFSSPDFNSLSRSRKQRQKRRSRSLLGFSCPPSAHRSVSTTATS